MSDDEVCCEYCGGEVWDASELQDGKCLLCVVQDCRHRNQDVASYDLKLHDLELILHMVCMECEICWDVKHYLNEGIESKYHHENLNNPDIND